MFFDFGLEMRNLTVLCHSFEQTSHSLFYSLHHKQYAMEFYANPINQQSILFVFDINIIICHLHDSRDLKYPPHHTTPQQSIFNLQKSFENGFNNFATVRGDPDLDPVKDQSDYKKLMNTYDAKGFNPFGFLGSKQ